MRYALGKYGDGSKYGESDHHPYLLWALEVAWNGQWLGINEADHLQGVTVRRGRESLITPGNNTLASLPIGSLEAVLDNRDRRYDPFNTNSPLYPYLAPGKIIRLSVRLGTDGERYYLFTGILTDIRPIGPLQVRLTAIELSSYLASTQVVLPVFRGARIRDIVSWVAQSSGWPGEVQIDESTQTLDCFYDSGSAWDILNRLAQISRGQVWVDGYGRLRFRTFVASLSSKVTIPGSSLLKSISLRMPWEVVKNSVQVAYYQRIYLEGIVASFKGPITLDPGKSINLVCTWSGESGRVLVLPGATLVPIANTSVDGKGEDISSAVTVIPLVMGAEQGWVSVNYSGTRLAYLLEIQVHGRALLVPTPGYSTEKDTGSINQYGERSLLLDSLGISLAESAREVAQQYLSYLSPVRKYFIVTLQGQPALQFPLDLFDRILLTLSGSGGSQDVVVGALEHTWHDETGQGFVTTVRLEPYLSHESWWTFPGTLGVSKLGF